MMSLLKTYSLRAFCREADGKECVRGFESHPPHMNEGVKVYINKQKNPQKEILLNVREIFFKTIKNCKEKVGWGVVVFADDRFYVAAMKERVHVGFAINGLTKEEIAQFEGSGKTMRHIKIRSLEDINEKKLVKLIKLVKKKAVCKHC